MQNNVNDDMIEIDLQELILFLLRRLWILLVFAVIGGAAAFLYTKFMVTPMYQSNTSIYILNKKDGGTYTSSDLNMGAQLSVDYIQMITSRTVMQAVIDDLGLDGSVGALQGSTSVKALGDSRILQITVRHSDPLTAKVLADEVRVKAAQIIKEVVDVEAVNTVDVANLPTGPYSPNIKKNTILGAGVGFALIAMIFVIQFLMDDTIKTAEDVEKYLGLSTLANIPVFAGEDAKKTKTKKRRKSEAPGKYEADFQEDDEIGEDLEEEDLKPVRRQVTSAKKEEE